MRNAAFIELNLELFLRQKYIALMRIECCGNCQQTPKVDTASAPARARVEAR
jgi:hypothetical protein